MAARSANPTGDEPHEGGLSLDPGVFFALSVALIFAFLFYLAVYFEKWMTLQDGIGLLAPALLSTVAFAFGTGWRNGWFFAAGVLCLGFFAVRFVRYVSRQRLR